MSWLDLFRAAVAQPARTGRSVVGLQPLRAPRRDHYPVGSELPSIPDLMREFDVPGLSTVRDAQQVLVREGLLRTEQGVGAWVLAQQSPTAEMTDALQRLRDARVQLDQAIAYLETQVGP